MPPVLKYTLARIGLFLVVLLALWPVNMNGYLKLILAVAFSAALSFFLLAGIRNEAAEKWLEASQRRRAEKERLRAALAGEDVPASPDAQPSPSAQRSSDRSSPDQSVSDRATGSDTGDGSGSH